MPRTTAGGQLDPEPRVATSHRRLALDAARRTRSQRLVASGRLALAAFSLLAIWLDPSEPARFSELAYGLLIAYVLWSAALAATTFRGRIEEPWLYLVHGADIGMFFLLVLVTAGPTSPFFVFFVFALVSATLSWGWRGTAVTAGVVLPLYGGIGAYSVYVLEGEGFDLGRFVTRSASLGVVALLLGYLGTHEGRLRADLLRLLDQIDDLSDRPPVVVERSLAQAAELFRAGRTLFVWEELEEPWVRWALWTPQETELQREAPGTFDPLVEAALVDSTFACRDLDRARPRARLEIVGGSKRWQGPIFDQGLRDRFGLGDVISTPVEGGPMRGRLLVLEPRRAGADDLILAELFARQMSARLERVDLVQRLQLEARNELAAKIGRDLHDGVIQSLTAATLKLEAAQRLLPAEGEAKALVHDVGRMLGDEQEQLRAFVRQAPPGTLGSVAARVALDERLRDLAQRVGLHWGLEVEVVLVGRPPVVPGAIAHEIDRIAHEALVNAARHGAATVARLELEELESAIRLRIDDNGRGFPFRGRYDLTELAKRRLGPVMLKQRVLSLRGDLTIDSSPQGARLEIRIPIQAG